MSFRRLYGTGSYGSGSSVLSGNYGNRNSGGLGYSSSFNSNSSPYSSAGSSASRSGSYSATPIKYSLSGSSSSSTTPRGSISGYSSGLSKYGGSYNFNPYSSATSSYRRSSLSRSSSLPRDYRRDSSLNSRYSSYSSRTSSPSRSSLYSRSITCRAVMPDGTTRLSRFDTKKPDNGSKTAGYPSSSSSSSKGASRSSVSSSKSETSTSDYESSTSDDESEEVVVTSSLSSKGISLQETKKSALTDGVRLGAKKRAEEDRAGSASNVGSPKASGKFSPEASSEAKPKKTKTKNHKKSSSDSFSRSSSGYISRSNSLSDRESLSKSSPPSSLRGARGTGGHNGDIDYKKLYEEQLAENSKLMDRLREHEKDLRVARETIDSNLKTSSARSALAESERREKRALERKLSEMEEELRQMQKLKTENEKLRAENRALTRVVSKLTNSATGSMGGQFSALSRPK